MSLAGAQMKLLFKAPAAIAIALHAHSLVHGPIVPDQHMTPGVIDKAVTQANISRTICQSGYTKTVRHTSASLKAQIYAEYRLDPHSIHAEVDHRVPLEAGGADVRQNLWVEDYDSHPYNAHRKDRLENYVHKAICAHAMSLTAGRAIFLGDWRPAYNKQFGSPQ